MHDFALVLYLTKHAEQAGAEQFLALAFDQAGMDDDIGEPCFIFQRDEYDTGGGGWTLAA